MCAVILVGLSFSKVKIPSGDSMSACPHVPVNETGWIVEVNFRLLIFTWKRFMQRTVLIK